QRLRSRAADPAAFGTRGAPHRSLRGNAAGDPEGRCRCGFRSAHDEAGGYQGAARVAGARGFVEAGEGAPVRAERSSVIPDSLSGARADPGDLLRGDAEESQELLVLLGGGPLELRVPAGQILVRKPGGAQQRLPSLLVHDADAGLVRVARKEAD